jgi:FtsZ-interacting cell division protein ZipA
MPELRWTLLIIGVLFVVILAWWERRRPHQASRQAPHISGEPRPVVNNDPSWGPEVETTSPSAGSRVVREPTLTLPEIRTEARTRDPFAPRELPVVEIPDDVADQVEEAMAAGEPVIARSPGVPSRPGVASKPVIAELPAGPNKPVADHAPMMAAAPMGPRPMTAPPTSPPIAARPVATPARAAPRTVESDERSDAESDMDADADAESDAENELDFDVGPVESAQSEPASVLPPPVLNTVSPIVDWPPEDQRRLVSLRLVARPPERFRGSLVRQALRAEGFVLGDLDIFHKPEAQNRAVLSAASLTKPGTFDLETMDSQRFVGLNLFVVLPGPRTPQKAFEDLLLTARMLNERLEGALQDERGGPLTPTRIQVIRDALGAEAKT